MRNVHLYRRQQDPTTVTPRAAEHKGIRRRFSRRPCVVVRSVASPVERRAAIILGAASGVHAAEAAAGPRPGPVHGPTALRPVEPGPGVDRAPTPGKLHGDQAVRLPPPAPPPRTHSRALPRPHNPRPHSHLPPPTRQKGTVSSGAGRWENSRRVRRGHGFRYRALRAGATRLESSAVSDTGFPAPPEQRSWRTTSQRNQPGPPEDDSRRR